jgi:N4-gp56 family major capsid protein
MTIQVTTNLTNSIRAQYLNEYVKGALGARLYDQFASPVASDMSNVAKGSSVIVPFMSHLAPSSTTISQVNDVTPTIMRDATATITPTSRTAAIQFSEALSLQAFTDYTARAHERVGEQMQNSIEQVAMNAALAGSLVTRAAARASLDAGTASHRLSRDTFINAAAMLQSIGITKADTPRGGRWMSLFNPLGLKDLLADSVILAVGEYQAGEMILNGEIGELNGIKIITDPRAKLFLAAGAANGTAVETTLAADANALATTLTVASGTNIAAGQRLMVGTHETGSTFYPTNEWVYVTGIDSVTVSFVGQGENGGLLYDHASGEAVSNDDNVMPVLFGGPESMAKVYQPENGEYGQLVGPKKAGIVDQWDLLGWKWYGGYGIVSQNQLWRYEVSLGIDA